MTAFVVRYTFFGEETSCVIIALDRQDAKTRFLNSQMDGTEILSIQPVNGD